MPTSYLEQQKNFFKTNSKVREYQVHSSKVHTIDWNCDGKRLASGSFDKSVVTFYLDKDKLTKDHVFRGHADSVDQLCWHPTHPDILATASGDKTVRLWDARSKKFLASINTKGENINICWSPDGQTIAVGNKEDLLTFIDYKTHKTKLEEHFKFEVNEISWNKTGNLFFITSGQGSVHIFSYPEWKLVKAIQAHPANCICIEFDPTNHYFAIGSADALVSLWKLKDMVCVRTLSRLEWPVRTLSFSHDGKMIASASEDLMVDVAEVETGEKIVEIPCESPTFTVSWHPKRFLLAYACDDKYDRERDAGTLKLFGLPDSKD